jgi:hypothetical protein
MRLAGEEEWSELKGEEVEVGDEVCMSKAYGVPIWWRGVLEGFVGGVSVLRRVVGGGT